jgi:prepilin-type N-terminal cleavage/methylation domain-containing protein
MNRAFTLIELLVVVTIIVVLLALLMPAMDKAIYQTELAVCASRLEAIGTGAIVYATQYQRSYPYRVYARSMQARPVDIRHMDLTGTGHFDERPVLRTFIAVNGALNDPLSPGEIDIEGSRPATNVISSYSLYFGWGYRGEKGMLRLGDRMSFQGESFDLLAGDVSWSFVDTGHNNHLAGHNDNSGLMQATHYQDELYVLWDYTMTHWTTAGRGARDPIDLNFVRADGSVTRYDRVEWYEGTGDANDPTGSQRFLWLPQWNIPGNQISALSQIPRR